MVKRSNKLRKSLEKDVQLSLQSYWTESQTYTLEETQIPEEPLYTGYPLTGNPSKL